jgi:signal transduction histidine kinase
MPAPLSTLTADRLRLKQVLINVVGNALKFTPQGSIDVRVLADARANPVALEVQDTGIGIPPHRVAAVFQPFTQADAHTQRQFGGTGLGLAISRALCEMMGFRLQVESEEASGARSGSSSAPHRLTPTATAGLNQAGRYVRERHNP